MNRRDDELAAQLAQVVFALLDPQPLSRQILALLSNGGTASGSQLAIVLRKRRQSVLKVCLALQRDGHLKRVGQKWKRVDR